MICLIKETKFSKYLTSRIGIVREWFGSLTHLIAKDSFLSILFLRTPFFFFKLWDQHVFQGARPSSLWRTPSLSWGKFLSWGSIYLWRIIIANAKMIHETLFGETKCTFGLLFCCKSNFMKKKNFGNYFMKKFDYKFISIWLKEIKKIDQIKRRDKKFILI